mgnify:CR=1 FL=1
MADGRVANIVISPGIGCTVFTNDSGKAISATFFAQGISTNTNSKATVVVAGAGMTITKNEILWQPSQCIACYSGFISDCPACRAYPDATKMGQVYNQGVFRSNVGTGRSGTPGYTCGMPRRYCGRGWMVGYEANYCYPSCCRYLDYPSNFNTCGSCINKPCGLYCCYEKYYLELNCCETGGVRFARPMDVFVGVGTTYTGYSNPINGTGGSPLFCLRFGESPWAMCGCQYPWDTTMPACGGNANKEPNEPGKHTPLYLQCFHLSVQGIKCGCDCYSSKCGYEMGCFVPMVYGGTEVINPALALTNPPLYNGEYSGFPNANGGCHCCNCYHGAMWGSLITGWFPGQYQNCYDWCCAYFCGTMNQCNVEQQRQEGSMCNEGAHGTQYLLTACNTPNLMDSAKRVIAPMDDTGVGAGMTGIPFCYCGNQPAFDNTKGGNPLWLQSSCSVWANCLNICNWCDMFNSCCVTQRTPSRSSAYMGSAMIDWYALTDYKNWCHCDTCVGRVTQGSPGNYLCNPVNNGCWCCEIHWCCMQGAADERMCEIVCCGGTSPGANPVPRKVMAPIVMQMHMRGWSAIRPALCIKPGSSECGKWIYCQEDQFRAYSYGCCTRGWVYNNEANHCYVSSAARSQSFHIGMAFPAGSCCCCYSGILGMQQCCFACHCWYCGCCCGPCMGAPYNKPMGCCGFMMSWGMRPCTCWRGYDSMRFISATSENATGNGKATTNPYGYHHGISCGIIMHWAGDQVYQIFPAAMDWLMPYCWNNQCGSYCCRVMWPIQIFLGGNLEYCGYGFCSGTPTNVSAGPDKYVYPQAMICEGLSNYWLCNKEGDTSFQPTCMYYSDTAGTVACKLVDDSAICAWTCLSGYAPYGTELAMKYFAYNPNVDCHYFMIRTQQDYTNFLAECEIKEFGPGSSKTQAELECCYYSGIKKEFFTREWCCGIFSLDCNAVMCYYSIKCNCCCSMRYDGGEHHQQYQAYPVWGDDSTEMCSGSTCCDTANNCLCCLCWNTMYRSRPCYAQAAAFCHQSTEVSGHPVYHTLKAQGGRFCASGADVGGATCYCCCRNFSGLGTVFFRKVANFPSIMSDHKYTQPRMCVGCLFRSDTAVWSLPVYNHCCFRWDAFITCDLINWNKQELEIVCKPDDQMGSTNYCQILSLENNYYCKCTDCFMAGFDRSGLMELCMSFNQYERTGLLINNTESIYVKSHNATDCFNFQIWGYEG